MPNVRKKMYIYKDGRYIIPETPELENIVGDIIEADKDIISQIKVEYDEEGNVTKFNFPVGVMPLSITLNTHQLYFKDGCIVGNNGQAVEGYGLDEYYSDNEENYITFIGDLSEQVINGLVYARYNGNIASIYNTYNLFYPASATKLYKHEYIKNNSWKLVVITTQLSFGKFASCAKKKYSVFQIVYTPFTGSFNEENSCEVLYSRATGANQENIQIGYTISTQTIDANKYIAVDVLTLYSSDISSHTVTEL